MKILVVEDDRILREGLVALMQREGYMAVAAANCQQADAMLQEKPDLVLLDVALPDGDGFSLCSQWRRSGVKTPILFLTAYDAEEQVVQGLDSGGDDYVAKPFQARELCSRIRARLRRVDPDVYRCGIFSIDRNTMTVEKDGIPLPLTRTEFMILSILIYHAGRLVQRDTLLGRIWDDAGVFVDDNTLSVHISRLRNKLGEGWIETVRGIGYRWNIHKGE